MMMIEKKDKLLSACFEEFFSLVQLFSYIYSWSVMQM